MGEIKKTAPQTLKTKAAGDKGKGDKGKRFIKHNGRRRQGKGSPQGDQHCLTRVRGDGILYTCLVEIAKNLTEYLTDPEVALPQRLSHADLANLIAALHQSSAPPGCSFNLYFGDVSGQNLYAVSLYPERTHPALSAELLEQILPFYLDDNEDLLQDPRHCVGTWFDSEEEIIYLDITATLLDKELSKLLGREYNQKKIFDLAARVEINTGGDGKEINEAWPSEAERLPPLTRGTNRG